MRWCRWWRRGGEGHIGSRSIELSSTRLDAQHVDAHLNSGAAWRPEPECRRYWLFFLHLDNQSNGGEVKAADTDGVYLAHVAEVRESARIMLRCPVVNRVVRDRDVPKPRRHAVVAVASILGALQGYSAMLVAAGGEVHGRLAVTHGLKAQQYHAV